MPRPYVYVQARGGHVEDLPPHRRGKGGGQGVQGAAHEGVWLVGELDQEAGGQVEGGGLLEGEADRGEGEAVADHQAPAPAVLLDEGEAERLSLQILEVAVDGALVHLAQAGKLGGPEALGVLVKKALEI
jgi:hypothetical protein